jgi:uncharacterized alpha-E superfamily protein
LHARLRFARIDRVLSRGIHDFLTEITRRLAELSAQMAQDFLMTV